MAEKSLISTILKNPKIRNPLILVVLLIILVSALMFNAKPPQAPIRKRVVICAECDDKSVLEFEDLKKCNCPKCKGPLGDAMKCKECDREFSYIDTQPTYWEKMSKKEKKEFKINARKCPNCNSQETYIIPNTNP